ncbi:LPXTG cell wall anchor domain-containing protein [Blastococcus litoris]|uniref:LPXTG cell wall anchor domain-containing protein n=1 Tax=Blastococcus litoris TaxID=2171622 RepID=UPI000E2FF6D9|nr:fibronectin type III domain-containing protein [Blastococcus litoris]
MQLTSSPRRALGLLAASTIGLSTALLGVAGVAQAAPADVPQAPTIDSVYGGDTTLSVFFAEAEEDEAFAYADDWEYQLDGGAWVDATVDWSSGFGQFDIPALTNGQTYSVKVRGVDTDEIDPGNDIAGTASAAKDGTPFKPIGAPGTPTVSTGPSSLTVSWTAPTVAGTYDLAGYEVLIPQSFGEMGGPSTICETGPATTTCTFGVKSGVAHDVWVVAFDEEGNYGVEVGPVASGVVPAPAVPATAPTKNGDLTIAGGASGVVAPGTKLTVSGTGYAAGSSVSVIIYSTPQVLTTVVADASGNFSVEVTVPAGLAAGSHTLVASGVDANGVLRYVTVPVTVSASGTAAVSGAKLANTGADVTVPAIAGLGVLGLGAGLIVVSRRRRTTA